MKWTGRKTEESPHTLWTTPLPLERALTVYVITRRGFPSTNSYHNASAHKGPIDTTCKHPLPEICVNSWQLKDKSADAPSHFEPYSIHACTTSCKFAFRLCEDLDVAVSRHAKKSASDPENRTRELIFSPVLAGYSMIDRGASFFVRRSCVGWRGFELYALREKITPFVVVPRWIVHHSVHTMVVAVFRAEFLVLCRKRYLGTNEHGGPNNTLTPKTPTPSSTQTGPESAKRRCAAYLPQTSRASAP